MTKKTQDEIQLKLKEFLNKGRNLIDYFLVIGTKPEIFLNSWLYQSNISQLNSDYYEEIFPQILSKFPPFDKKLIKIDDSIIQHCFPNGFFIEEFIKTPEPEIFSILLDNNYSSLEYSFKYVVCIKFYESITNYKKLYEKYISIQNENDNSNINTERIDSTSVFSKISDLNIQKVKYKKYYIPKCICLISLYPFINEMIKIIKNIYKYTIVKKQQIPIEKIISNLIIEVPTPPRGIYSIEYNFINEKIIFKQNLINQLPTLNIDFRKLFSIFLINQVLEIFKHLMLNNRIVFFSSDIKLLSPIILSSLILLYPFKFPFNVVSILPKEVYHFMDSIFSFVYGINEKYKSTFFKDNEIEITETFLIVDIDNKRLEVLGKKNCPDLPLKYKNALIEKYNNYNQIIHQNAKLNIQESSENFTNNIRQFFFDFQISLMKNYNKYLNDKIYSHQDSKDPFENAFKVKEFLNNVKYENLNFYEKFIKTQMFCDFIFKRMTPKEKSEKLDILLFEEKIFQKQNNHKINTILLSSNDYQITKKYTVPRPKNLTEKQIEFFTNNKLNLILDGIYVSSFQKKNLNFTYFIFPKLQDDFFFNSDSRNYFLFPEFFSEIENINSDIIAKSHLNSIQIKKCDMEDYINLLWLKIWVLTFWYHDKNEREFRFNQMLNVLDQVKNHEMELINNLFKVLVDNQTNDHLILKLYEKIFNLRINPTQFILDIIKKIIGKIEKNNKNNNKEKINEFNLIKYLKNIQIFYKKESKIYFRKRTSKSKYDINILKPTIKFYTKQICQECGKNINLFDLLKNTNDDEIKEILWAKCPYDQTKFLPILSVRFGNEFNKSSDLNLNTSILDHIALYSPYTLYYTMLNSIIVDNKLDIINFKSNYNPIFWNLIWYFNSENLPIDFLLPYESDIIYNNNLAENQLNEIKSNLNITFKKLNDIKKPNSLLNSCKKATKYKNLEIQQEIILEIEKTMQKLTDDNKSNYHENMHNILISGESFINGNNLVDTSSIFTDISSKFENESVEIKRNNRIIHGGSIKILKKLCLNTNLGEIKEEFDQKENTPNKKNNNDNSNSPSPIGLILSNSPLNLRPHSTFKGKRMNTENDNYEKEIFEQEINPFKTEN